MFKIFRDKKGTDKILSIYWFAILFIVAAAVVYMAYSFYGDPYDVREVEANLLANRVADCFQEGGVFNKYVLQDEFFILEGCNLTFNEGETREEEKDQLFLSIGVYEFDFSQEDLKGDVLKELGQGNFNLEACSSVPDNSPFCVRRSFYSQDSEGNKYLLEVLASVRKTEKNV